MRHNKRRKNRPYREPNPVALEPEKFVTKKSDSQILRDRPDVAYISDTTEEWIKARSDRQKDYIETIRKNDLIICIGPAGTGKTFLPVAMALQALKDGSVSRIIITRPAVEAGEKLGYLPGDLEEKISPYLRPIYDALFYMVGPERADEFMRMKTIEVAPLAFMRGRTLEDAFIILDEAQNTTMEQIEMFLTRMGNGSKVVVTGDITQIDLPKKKSSGLLKLREIIGDMEGTKFFFFTEQDVVRHPLVKKIVKAYETWKEKNGTE